MNQPNTTCSDPTTFFPTQACQPALPVSYSPVSSMTARECKEFLDSDRRLRVNIPRIPRRRQRPVRESTTRGENTTTNSSYALGFNGIIEGERTCKKPSLFSFSLDNIQPKVDRSKTTVQDDKSNHTRDKVTQETGTRLSKVPKHNVRGYRNDRATDETNDWIYNINSFFVRTCNAPAHTNTRFAYAASALLNTVDINHDNIHE